VEEPPTIRAEAPTGHCLQSEELRHVGQWWTGADNQVVDEHNHHERTERGGEDFTLGSVSAALNRTRSGLTNTAS
jgi:hypothetical protein